MKEKEEKKRKEKETKRKDNELKTVPPRENPGIQPMEAVLDCRMAHATTAQY